MYVILSRRVPGRRTATYCAMFAVGFVHAALAMENAPGDSSVGANCSQVRVLQGCGTYVWPDGIKYVGGFRGGYFDGFGTVYYSDGSRFEGEFENASAHGDAVYFYADGTKLSGRFHDVTNDMSRPHALVRYPFWRAFLRDRSSVLLTVIVSGRVLFGVEGHDFIIVMNRSLQW